MKLLLNDHIDRPNRHKNSHKLYNETRHVLSLLNLTKSQWKAWPDIYDGGYIHQFQSGPTHKTQYQQYKHRVYIHLPTEHLSNHHEDGPNQHKNISCAMKKEIPFLCLKESQNKLRYQYDQNFPRGRESHCKTNTRVRR